MKRPLFTLIALLSTFYLIAKDKNPSVISFDEAANRIEIPEGTFYLQDIRGKLTIEKILHKSAPFKFRESNGTAQTFAGNGKSYWFRFVIENARKIDQDIIITLPVAFYDDVDFYVTRKDSLSQAPQHLSWRIPQKQRPFPHRNFIFRCHITACDTVVCYLKVRKDFGSIWLPMSLWTESYFNYRFYAFDYTSWGFIVGAFLFIAFFAFLIFLALRDRIYATYGFYVLCMLGFVLSSQGFYMRYYDHGFLGIEANKLRFYFTLLILASSAGFTYDYLRIKEHPNYWIGISFKALIYFLFFLQLFMYADHLLLHDYLYKSDRSTLTSIFTFFFWIPSIFVFGTVIYCIASDYRRSEAIYYTVANSPLFLLVIYTAFSNYGWLPSFTLGSIDYFAMAFLIEVVILSIALAYRFKLIKEGREKLMIEKNELLQQRTQVVIEAEERERVRIARDLHDGIGQLLAAARMGLGGSFYKKVDERQLQNVLDLLEESIREIRNISHNMMPNVLVKLGLVSAIQNFIDKINITNLIDIDFHAIGMDERLDESTEMGLYRVIQETFNNILKHAEATKVTIQLIKYDDELVMTIEDNGIGFDPNKVNGTGIGLKNIATRVEYLNGIVNFESSPQKGTSVIVELPLLQSHAK